MARAAAAIFLYTSILVFFTITVLALAGTLDGYFPSTSNLAAKCPCMCTCVTPPSPVPAPKAPPVAGWKVAAKYAGIFFAGLGGCMIKLEVFFRYGYDLHKALIFMQQEHSIQLQLLSITTSFGFHYMTAEKLGPMVISSAAVISILSHTALFGNRKIQTDLGGVTILQSVLLFGDIIFNQPNLRVYCLIPILPIVYTAIILKIRDRRDDVTPPHHTSHISAHMIRPPYEPKSAMWMIHPELKVKLSSLYCEIMMVTQPSDSRPIRVMALLDMTSEV